LKLIESLFHLNLAGAFRQTADGQLVDCNDACARMLGYGSREELLAHGRFDYLTPSDPITIQAALQDLGTLTGLEVALRKKDGSSAWIYWSVASITEGGSQYVDGVALEITEQRLATERIEHQAHHDPLTGLPNQSLFVDRLNVAVAHARRQGRPLAVLFVDLDHFELINTTFGRGLADRLLKAVADRLSGLMRAEDTVARFGSDEFAILISDFGPNENTALIAQKILDTVSRQEVLEGHDVYVNATIGIALFPDDGVDAETLIKNADAAMYRAKQLGRNTYRLYAPEANARAFERQSLVVGLRRALERDELLLYYQPEVNVQTGRIEAIEALLRWRHPEMGLVEPAAFLPAAEEGHLINPIGNWVLRQACSQLKFWRQLGIRSIPIAVNLSTRQFGYADLMRLVEGAIREFDVDPEMLELEIAQHTIHDADASVPRLMALKKLGVRLAIDDFGTGRSSLADLKKMPIDTIKIDQAFIRNVTTQSNDASIVEAVIRMARGFDIRVVAEGVETKDQMTFLWNRRCTDMQGYFFGKPMPAPALEETLRLQH